MSKKIIILPEAIANRIAAGEIIERPASVVRELLDNAIDADSTRIEIDIENGGLNLVRVTDNGHGFDPDGLFLAFERHATSKIKSLDDLDTIHTLGFRGEALPSIASVARVTVESLTIDADSGARLRINGGKVESMESVVCAPGTRFTVRNLFYNTPARRKFLKSRKTEYNHIYETVIDHAVTYTNTHFVLRDDGRTTVDAPAVDVWSARIASLFGNKFISQMIPLDTAHPEIVLQGMICHPNHLRSTGRAQRLYVNGRRIRDRIVTQAIYRAYNQFITGSGHPAYILRIELPPEMVDVNVHPAKSEVRFRDSGAVFNYISTAVNSVLAGSMKHHYDLGSRDAALPAPVPSQTPAPDQPQLLTRPGTARSFQPDYRTVGDATSLGTVGTAYPSTTAPSSEPADHTPYQQVIRGNDWRLVGQVYSTFILVEVGQHLLIIDQHTAHERLLFELFKEKYQQGSVPSQALLFPAPVELEPPQYQILLEFQGLLASMGLQIDSFGRNTIVVTALPEHLNQETPEMLLQNLSDELLEVGTTERSRIAERKMLVSLACRRAIKAGDPLKHHEMEGLISDIMANEIPNSCPHGRPIIVTMDQSELARKFKR